MAKEYQKGDQTFVEAECSAELDGEPCGNCWACNLGDAEVIYRDGHRFLERHEASGEFICTHCGAWEQDEPAVACEVKEYLDMLERY